MGYPQGRVFSNPNASCTLKFDGRIGSVRFAASHATRSDSSARPPSTRLEAVGEGPNRTPMDETVTSEPRVLGGMYTFVVGIDADDSRALAQAKTIAEMPLEADDVRVILLHSFKEKTKGSTVEQVKPVRLARDRLEDADITVEVEGYGGDAARAILNVAEDNDADQIVLAGRKRTPTGKVLFGSVTQSVILDTERPVLVCSADEE